MTTDPTGTSETTGTTGAEGDAIPPRADEHEHQHGACASQRLYRPEEGRVLGGVAAGLAEHFGLDVTFVRLAFVLFALFGGAGLALYVAAWLVVPDEATNASVLAELLHPPFPA